MNTGYMKLKPHQVKQLREQKAWSQSHLAEVSGLSLRTIQRIEKEDTASQESVQALASVFETSTNKLLAETSPKNNRVLFPATAFAALIAFVVAYFWVTPSTASNLTLDISASFKQLETPLPTAYPELSKKAEQAENLYTIDTSIILQEKEITTVKVNDHVEMDIAAFFVEDGKILLTARIVDISKDAKPVVAAPKIITDNHVEAFLMVNDEDTGAIYKVGITPHK